MNTYTIIPKLDYNDKPIIATSKMILDKIIIWSCAGVFIKKSNMGWNDEEFDAMCFIRYEQIPSNYTVTEVLSNLLVLDSCHKKEIFVILRAHLDNAIKEDMLRK